MLLQTLSNRAGVSGNEGPIRKLLIPAVKDYVDDLTVDTMGNVYAVKHGTGDSPLTVMVTAHMDEVGFMITKITAGGLLKFETVGGIDPRILPGQTVLVGPKQQPGVIGAKALHNLSGAERTAAPTAGGLAIDIGAAGKEAAEASVSIGDYAVFATRFGFLNTPPGDGKTGVVKGKALDDRAGCAMLVELLRRTHPVNVVGVFSVQEEIGLRGAQVAAHKVDPDLSIVLECTTADDLPPAPDEPIGYPRLGDGPCLTIMDRSFIAGRQLLEHIKTTAERHNIPWQYKRPGLGGTDSGAIHKSRAGIPSVTVAVPARYIHSPAALVQLTDFWHCVELIAAALRHMPQRRPDPSL